MFCGNCGIELNEEVKFCSKCGTAIDDILIDSFQNEGTQELHPIEINTQVLNDVSSSKAGRGLYFSNENLTTKNAESATISVGDWIRILAPSILCIIPMIGLVVYTIILLSLAFKKDTAPSLANYSKAIIIIGLLYSILGLIVVYMFFQQEMINLLTYLISFLVN